MRNRVRTILVAATSGIVGFFSQNTHAQQINYTAGTYTQDFNSLPISGLTGTSAFANTTGPFDLTQATPNGLGAGAAMTGWYAGQITGANPLKLYTTDGSNVQASIGGLGSFGAAGDSERSLGSFSNTGSQARFGAKFVNTSSTTFTTFTIDYDVEQWAQSATTIDFLNRLEYGIGATTLNTGTYTVIGPTDTAAGGGSWNSLITGAATQTLNGNDPANQTHKTFTIDGIAWVPGQSLFLRWNDVNDAGTEAALAIDNFNFTAASVGNILAWKGTPNGTWDTNSANKPWLNGAAAASFNNNDVVTFGDIPANAAITVDAGGVIPGSTTFTHASKIYTFSGGPISGPMTISGAGTVVFTAPNNFSAVNLNAGSVELKVNNALGSGTVSLGNAVINITTTDHTFSNPLVITGSGTISTSVPLIITSSVNGVAGTKLTINNTSATFVDLPNLVGGASNYAGDFHVAAGVVKYTGATDGDLFSATTIVTVDTGATLDFGVNGDSFGGLQGGGNVILTDTPGSFLNLQAAGDRTFSGIISGTTVNAATVGLHQQGGGVFTITGKNTFKAPTTISFGTIVVGGNVLPDTDGPLGNSSTAIQLGDGGASTSNVVGLIISGAFEVARPITIPSNTNTVAITLGGNTDDNTVFSGAIDMGKSPRFTSVTTGNKAVTFSGPILASGTNAHGITKIGTGLVILSNPNNTFLNPVTINEGTLRVTGSIATSAGVTVNTGGTFEAGATQTVQNLTINAGGKAKVLTGVLTVGGNSTNAGVLDLTTRGLIFDYPAGNEALALQGIRAQIVSGYNATPLGAGNGDWKGNGITSSSITTNSKAIGYAQATEVILGPGNTFMGAPVPDTTAILTRFTFAGDADLDGTVGFADLVAVAQHYGQSDGNALWTQGDFNYDGNVGFADLVSVAQNYGGVLPASAIPGAAPDFAPDLAAAFASLPEPSAITLIALSAAPLLRRRKK